MDIRRLKMGGGTISWLIYDKIYRDTWSKVKIPMLI